MELFIYKNLSLNSSCLFTGGLCRKMRKTGAKLSLAILRKYPKLLKKLSNGTVT